MTTVELICFGNELLIRKTVNANAHWLGKRLTQLGAELVRITTVRDILEEMSSVVKEVLHRSPDVIITTGGLGPTFDDMALEAIAKALDRKLVLNKRALKLIRERFDYLKKERNIDIPFTKERENMAEIPQEATPLKNRAGSAPGIMLKEKDVLLFAVPGVPREMKAIFDFELVPYFSELSDTQYYERSIQVSNIPESEIAKAITSVREEYPSIYFKTHPKTSLEVEIHLTTVSAVDMQKKLKTVEEKIVSILKKLEGTNGKRAEITLSNDRK
ncbi:MAG: competence damage-inducible protein A [Candidatus Heimdallarchaeota archaeon]|nr:competence damage-inducible protein A [Candidatus Heimdallarchaeota archaeon]